MLYMMNTVSDQLTYNTNITNYQIKTLKWMKSKLDRFLINFDAIIENIVNLKKGKMKCDLIFRKIDFCFK